MKAFSVLLIIAIAAIAIFFTAVTVRPEIAWLPLWLISPPKENCKNSPVLKYASGDYYPCTGNPLTRENVNAQINGQCPLLIAASYGKLDIFNELLTFGATPKQCTNDPDKFFIVLVGSSCEDVIEPIVRNFIERYKAAGIIPSSSQNLLFLGAKSRCVPAIEYAIELGADVNAPDNKGFPALFYTTAIASEGSIKSSARLVKAGANPKLQLANGDSLIESSRKLCGSASNWPRLEAALLTANTEPTQSK